MIHTKAELVLIAEAAANDSRCDPALICAICDISSEWHPEKIEYELGDFRWGLMQIKGSEAKQHISDPLDRLIEPCFNLELGCRLVTRYMRQCSENVERALVLWSGQIAGVFPQRVLAKRDLYVDFLAAKPSSLRSSA